MPALLAGISVSCRDVTNVDCGCSLEFRLYTVTIVDTASHPLDSFITWLIKKQTGAVIRKDSSHMHGSGTGVYAVISDGELSYIHGTDTVIFHAADESHSVSQEYVFSTDQCRCHIYKSAGPDTIVVM